MQLQDIIKKYLGTLKSSSIGVFYFMRLICL